MTHEETDLPDGRLKAWVESVMQDTTVVFASPGDEREEKRGVALHLLELKADPPLRTPKTAPLQLSLRYLVTVWAEQPEEAQRLLVNLAFAAMDAPSFEFDPAPLPAATWSAFGLPPQAAFVLDVPVRRTRPEPERHYVMNPLVVEVTPRTSLHGVVLSPDDIPIADAVVALPGLRSSARTDHRGAFSFSNVPHLSGARRFHVRARGRARLVTAEDAEADPLIIRFDPISEEV